jgi:hypothetical protein
LKNPKNEKRHGKIQALVLLPVLHREHGSSIMIARDPYMGREAQKNPLAFALRKGIEPSVAKAFELEGGDDISHKALVFTNMPAALIHDIEKGGNARPILGGLKLHILIYKGTQKVSPMRDLGV